MWLGRNGHGQGKRGVAGVGERMNHISINWRVSVASETLTGVTQLKIGDVCLSVCMDVRMSFCTLTLAYFCVRPRSTPSQTSLNSILWFSDHYPYHLRN